MPIAIPADLQALLQKLQHLADYVGFESNDRKVWCYLSWHGDAPGDDPQDTTWEAYIDAKQVVEEAGYEIGESYSDHDSAQFEILLPKKGNEMELQVNIEPKQIEEMVVNSILNSALGEAIKKEVEAAINGLQKPDGPIRTAISGEIQRIVLRVIMDEFGDKIREAVREYLTDKVVGEFTQAALEAFWEKMEKVRTGRGY